MTAKEMFENLGCKVENHLSTVYILNLNDIVIMKFTDNYYTTETAFNITPVIHKAIQKQIEELGWNRYVKDKRL